MLALWQLGDDRRDTWFGFSCLAPQGHEQLTVIRWGRLFHQASPFFRHCFAVDALGRGGWVSFPISCPQLSRRAMLQGGPKTQKTHQLRHWLADQIQSRLNGRGNAGKSCEQMLG